MNWSEERYVRLYTRDTDDWLALSWQAQGLLPQLLRKADRAGVIETRRAAQGIAIIIRWPLEVVEPALTALLADGVLVACERGYVFRNFVEAQEATKSDRFRAREYRESVRDRALAGVTKSDATVTPRHEDGTPCDDSVTKSDATVTPNGDRHAASQTVTPYRTVPSRTVHARVTRDARVADLASAAVAEINALAGKKYQPDTEGTVRACEALVKANITTEQVLAAIRHEGGPWVGHATYHDKIRPSTLLQLPRVRRVLEDLAAGTSKPPGLRLVAPSADVIEIDGKSYEVPA